MKHFEEAFYTDDFDQEMLDYLKDNFSITPSEKEWEISDEVLVHGNNVNYFWTDSSLCNYITNNFKRLTKNQFKEKIGMTNKKSDKQERIFKLVDKDGYICSGDWNRQLLTDNGIFADGNYYLKGVLSSIGDLLSLEDDSILIDDENDEFQYFEEVDRIPLPKDKPLLENYFVEPNELCEEVTSEQAELCEDNPNTFTKSMLVSGNHIVETCQNDRYLVAGDYLIGLNGYNGLKDYSHSLEHRDGEWDIVKIYSGQSNLNSDGIMAGQGFYSYLKSEKLTLIWQRESPEQKEKRLYKESLELKLQELKKECKLYEDEIMKLGD